MEERLLKYFRDHEAEIFGDLERLVKTAETFRSIRCC